MATITSPRSPGIPGEATTSRKLAVPAGAFPVDRLPVDGAVVGAAGTGWVFMTGIGRRVSGRAPRPLFFIAFGLIARSFVELSQRISFYDD